MSRVAGYLVEDDSQHAEKLGVRCRGEREMKCEDELGSLCGEMKKDTWQDRRSAVGGSSGTDPVGPCRRL